MAQRQAVWDLENDFEFASNLSLKNLIPKQCISPTGREFWIRITATFTTLSLVFGNHLHLLIPHLHISYDSTQLTSWLFTGQQAVLLIFHWFSSALFRLCLIWEIPFPNRFVYLSFECERSFWYMNIISMNYVYKGQLILMNLLFTTKYFNCTKKYTYHQDF